MLFVFVFEMFFFFQQVALFSDGLKGLLTHQKRHIFVLRCGFKSVSIRSSTSGNNCLRNMLFFWFGLCYVSYLKCNV